jgi:hypothetical protein
VETLNHLSPLMLHIWLLTKDELYFVTQKPKTGKAFVSTPGWLGPVAIREDPQHVFLETLGGSVALFQGR